MITLADIFRCFAGVYLQQFSANIPSIHQKAIRDMIRCRTPAAGGKVFYCQDCRQYQFSYHSCGNRHCNNCQHDRAQKWLKDHTAKLLPVPYFLLTFTLHPNLRTLARSHQKRFYDLLFGCAAAALQKLAEDFKYLGGKIGMMGILHTWGRDLSFHPHVHFLMPGIAYFEEADALLHANENFLLPVKALSKIFKAKFRDALKKESHEIFREIESQTWKDQWIVHCENVGRGQTALKYLATYVFGVAIIDNRILEMDNETLIFKYRDSQTGQWKIMKLHALEFIRRFLQHVLPRGFQKVRYYGFLATRNKKLLSRIRTLLNREDRHPSPPQNSDDKDRSFRCPLCNQPMIFISEIFPGMPWPHAPPNHRKAFEFLTKPEYS